MVNTAAMGYVLCLAAPMTGSVQVKIAALEGVNLMRASQIQSASVTKIQIVLQIQKTNIAAMDIVKVKKDV